MWIEQLDASELAEVRRACLHLFPGSAAAGPFLRDLKLEAVKRAYRERAKACHPDAAGSRPPSRHGDFHEVSDAYRLLSRYLASPFHTAPRGGGGPGKIIAVGGGKGGTGKSLFAANLALHLSSVGLKVVAVDLDLGGANLHLYFGQRKIPSRTVDDFLDRRAPTLGELAVPTEHGPLLIGGDGAALGAANLPFASKLRLLRELRRLDADFVVVDLGAGTSYNTLDLFIAADYGIVVTTREAPAYISAYHFLKCALYRKLGRAFGPESRHAGRRDRTLERFLADWLADPATLPSIRELRARGRCRPELDHRLLDELLADFVPRLVVNRLPPGADPHSVVDKIRSVSLHHLDRDVTYLGSLSQSTEVEQSTLAGLPALRSTARARLGPELRAVARSLLLGA